MKAVAFVVNRLSEFDFAPLIEKYLESDRVAILDHFPDEPGQFDLIVLWSYRRIVRRPEAPDNVIIFHSSDLPKGRGWAPIYHALAGAQPTYTLCGIKLSHPVDTGDIVVKARFPILPHHTASRLREFDNELSVVLVREILRRFDGRKIKGAPQTGDGTYFPRRSTADNEVDISRPLAELIPHLRASEPRHPAFFMHEGEKYLITIEPERKATFPEDVEILFFD